MGSDAQMNRLLIVINNQQPIRLLLSQPLHDRSKSPLGGLLSFSGAWGVGVTTVDAPLSLSSGALALWGLIPLEEHPTRSGVKKAIMT
jgi:hypothetical protein